jgi:hypothetical protein
MPSLKDHLLSDLNHGYMAHPEVHHLLDQFAHYPDMEFLSRHRKFLHHKEGIEYVTMRWGEEAGKSAEQHVIDDCGHIPSAIDYYRGSVDNFGYKIKGR